MSYRNVIQSNEYHKWETWSRSRWGSSKYYTNYVHTSLIGIRSDAISTQPDLSGSYYLPTPYEAFRCFATGEPFAYETQHGFWGWDEISGVAASSAIVNGHRYGCTSVAPYNPIIPIKVRSRCASKVQNAIRDVDMDIGQTLGEAAETLGFIMLTAKNVLKALIGINNLFRGRVPPGGLRIPPVYHSRLGTTPTRQVFNDASSAWLSLQYGWKPMLNDIYQAIELLKNGIISPDTFSLVRISRDTEFNGDALEAQNAAINAKVLDPSVWNRGVEIGVSFVINDETLYGLQQLGLTNPLGTAWELVPLSFVVDWFIPVGNFLQALTRPVGLRFQHGYETHFANFQARVQYVPQGYHAGVKPVVSYKQNASRRWPTVTFPIPVPSWDPKLNLSKYASIAALINLARS